MKHLRLRRLVLFVNHDPWSWLGWSLQWDYHSIIGSLTIVTGELGFEWVRGKSNLSIKKTSYGWSWVKET